VQPRKTVQLGFVHGRKTKAKAGFLDPVMAQFPTMATSPVSRPKIADRPHLLAILLSLIAIVLSSFSLYESHMARKLNEVTDRAVIQPESIRLLSDWKWNVIEGKKTSNVPIEITLHNSGKSLARNIHVGVTLGIAVMARKPGEQTGSPNKVTIEVGAATLLPDNMGPGVNSVYRLLLDASQLQKAVKIQLEPEGNVTDIIISPSLAYEDEATQGKYTDDFCYRAKADKNGVVKAGTVFPCPVFGRGVVTIP